MISDRHKLIFVHLRRTGGNSIEHALGGIALLNAAGEPTDHWDNQLHRGKTRFKIDRRGHSIHDTATQIRQRFPQKFESYFKFSIVRNPWAQMASLFLRRMPTGGKAQFTEFLRQFELYSGTVPQRSLFDDEGSLLVDFVGRFETLGDDFARVCERAELGALSLPKLNRGPATVYRSMYDRHTAGLVETMFRDDIERYGYTF